MKGIILAGGTGSRLGPLTSVSSKHLLPIYDKPMIYYPLSVLLLAGIRDLLIIVTPHEMSQYKDLLGDGSQFGVSIQYAVQEQANGIAAAFDIGADFIANNQIALILGDNIFFGDELAHKLKIAADRKVGATIFAIPVNEPNRYGVVEIDSRGNALQIEEKPEIAKSNLAVTGLYFYDSDVVRIARSIAPSARGELEITEVNNRYIAAGKLSCEVFGRGMAWFDAGNPDSLLAASLFIQTIEKRLGLKIACIEEIAANNNWINSGTIRSQYEKHRNSAYGAYLQQVLNEVAHDD